MDAGGLYGSHFLWYFHFYRGYGLCFSDGPGAGGWDRPWNGHVSGLSGNTPHAHGDVSVD